MNKFWKWKSRAVMNAAGEPTTVRTLFLDGPIASESWFEDEVTPQIFKGELESGEGPIRVWINSPGGDVLAAAQIYNMILDYATSPNGGDVTVIIDGIAASAASVIAMAGTTVKISNVGQIMIHNPSTIAFGQKTDLEKAIGMLESTKASIINAYQSKTGLSEAKLSHMMDAETWMNAKKAVELGFADEIFGRDGSAEDAPESESAAMEFSPVALNNSVRDHIAAKFKLKQSEPDNRVSVSDLMGELEKIKNTWR